MVDVDASSENFKQYMGSSLKKPKQDKLALPVSHNNTPNMN